MQVISHHALTQKSRNHHLRRPWEVKIRRLVHFDDESNKEAFYPKEEGIAREDEAINSFFPQTLKALRTLLLPCLSKLRDSLIQWHTHIMNNVFNSNISFCFEACLI